MQITQLDIADAYVVTPRQFADSRGAFMEAYKSTAFRDAVGRPFDVAQVNRSISRRGVVRGIHFASTPPGQAKYVSCVSGKIADVIVDIRVESPTFGKHTIVELDDQECRSVFLSEGLGHGFVALSDSATVMYLCSTEYDPDAEFGIHPMDDELSIAWPGADEQPLARSEAVLSDKDAKAPTLGEARHLGLLPEMTRCTQWAKYLTNRG